MKIQQLEKTIKKRSQANPLSSYTARLLTKSDLRDVAQKVGEEAVELVISSQYPDKVRIIQEGADLIYHFLVLITACDVSLSQIEAELERRKK